MHLFLLSINNSGSSILHEKIRQSKYTTTLPDEGQFIQGFYEINNLTTHSVENNSTENQIHIIMDIFDKNIKEYPEYWMN